MKRRQNKNTTMIEAAPEIIKHARALLVGIQMRNSMNELYDTMRALEAAIKKATGEAR